MGDGRDGMLINQMIGLSAKDEAEVIETDDDPLELTASDKFDGHSISIPAKLVEKLILNVNLVLDDGHSLLPLKKT